jgi:hypothetical protein
MCAAWKIQIMRPKLLRNSMATLVIAICMAFLGFLAGAALGGLAGYALGSLSGPGWYNWNYYPYWHSAPYYYAPAYPQPYYYPMYYPSYPRFYRVYPGFGYW